jgi:hypothetical protein
MEFDFSVLEGFGDDMMSRKKQQIGRARALNMKMIDDIFKNTTDLEHGDEADEEKNEATDPNSFEVVGTPRYATRKELEEIEECGAQAIDQNTLLAFAMGQAGDVIGVPGAQNPEDWEVSKDWFTDSNQEFLDRTGNGERWIEVVNDLARRFSEFFDGSYEAFDFAADAFGRRAWEMGLTEAQMMADEFDRSGSFQMPKQVPIFEVAHRGKTTRLEPGKDLRVLRITEEQTVRIKNRSRK